MRKLLLIALLSISAWFVIPSVADERPADRLRSDIQRAIRNGHPTEDELATLQRARDALHPARTARSGGPPADRTRLAMFLPADRQAIQHDIQEIQKRHDN